MHHRTHDAGRGMTPDEASLLIADEARAGRDAARIVARAGPAKRAEALRKCASSLRRHRDAVLAANGADLARFVGKSGLRDRLTLDAGRIEAMATGVETVASRPDPLGVVLAEWTRPNGLRIRKVASPIGVIGMIYESRPNVGADAASVTLKSGNAVLLRGGSDAFATAAAIQSAMEEGLLAAGLPREAIQAARTPDRAYVAAMLGAAGLIDLIIPRGGRSLVERVRAEARVPVLSHAEGVCHTYVHQAADPEMAVRIVVNAKMRRTGICGATETLLIDRAIAPGLLPRIASVLGALGCELRGDERARAVWPAMRPAGPDDFGREFLDAILAVGVVDDLAAALDHIARHGSEHTDAIVTEDPTAARAFLDGTDGAVAMWNASTQFCDGGEFGFGAEIGIATGRLHARGPVGPDQLTTFRYEVIGGGQVRP